MGELGGDLRADVIIIGAGVNGAILAAQLDGLPARVLLVEAGSLATTGAADERWTAETDGQAFIGADTGRRRGFGGSGAWWAGQCAPFDPIDLEPRDWVGHSGWPIAWSDLAPWYAEAAAALGIAGESFTQSQWIRRRISPIADLEHKFSAFIPVPDVAHQLLPALRASANIGVLVDTRVRRIVRDRESIRVAGVEVLRGPGPSQFIAAPIVVLAAGGIESPRIMLASATPGEPGGVGNPHDLAGRFLHDHPNGIAAQVFPSDRRRFDDLYGMLYAPHSLRRTRNWARIPLPAPVQREQKLVNALGSVDFADDAGPLGAVKRLVRGTGRARDAVSGLPAVPGIAWRRVRGLSPVHRGGDVLLRISAEQPPRWDSRVRLSDRADERGIPRPVIDWRLGDEERQAQRALVETVAQAWARAGIATLTPMPYLRDHGQWREYQVDALHHSGTLRMASSARAGIVGPDLECHDLPGLYVAGSAVFPTSSSANPTFTSVALTLRLASRLKATLGN